MFGLHYAAFSTHTCDTQSQTLCRVSLDHEPVAFIDVESAQDDCSIHVHVI